MSSLRSLVDNVKAERVPTENDPITIKWMKLKPLDEDWFAVRVELKALYWCILRADTQLRVAGRRAVFPTVNMVAV